MMILFSLLSVMSSSIMSMQILTKLYGNKKSLAIHIKRAITNRYYDGCTSRPDDGYSTFMITWLAIEIKNLEQEKKRLDTIGIHDLKDEKTMERLLEIKMYEDLIHKNKGLLRSHLDSMHKKNNAFVE